MSAPAGGPTGLRWLASLLIRGTDGVFVRADIEEAFRRDLARGVPALRARVRYVGNVVASSASLWRQRVVRPRLSISRLDFRLGLRMLVKFPGLTVIGGLAMAFAIWVGAVTFEVVNQIVEPELPLPDGDRIVGIQNLDTETVRPATPFMEDFVALRREITTIEDVGAFRSRARNLIVDGSVSEPVLAAEMSAAGFRVAAVGPLLGRTLFDSDEEPGATPVVVIGYETWQRRFGRDPDVVGTVIGVGRERTTVVGVMPEGFGFPLSHDIWIPLRHSPVDLGPGEGGRVAVFGTLAPGLSVATAQAELDAIGERRAQAFPAHLDHIRPSLVPYARSVQPLPDIGSEGLMAINGFTIMLLVLICGNVALLVFARAVSRQSELAVRSALGASRGRIAGQLFAEALVLGGLAAVAGVMAAGAGVRWFVAMSEADNGGRIAFWMRGGLAPETIVYLCGLTLLGAAVAGLVPALSVTGRSVDARLRQATQRSGGSRFGGVWTTVVVAQVAVTVAFPATAFFFKRYVSNIRSADLGFAAQEYLTARLEIDSPIPATTTAVHPEPNAERIANAWTRLARRLAAEPNVVSATIGDRLPGMIHPQARVEIDPVERAGQPAPVIDRAGAASVDVDFLSVIGAPVTTGRDFQPADARPGSNTVLVNRAFADRLLGGRNVVGRRLRTVSPEGEPAGPWLEIVGVTDNLGMLGGDFDVPGTEPGFYRPLVPGRVYPIQVAVRLRGDALAFVPVLRSMAAAVDPELRLHDIRRMDRVSESLWTESAFAYRLLTGVSLVALMLSLTSIYAVTAFAVSRRRHEIGVRVALGSDRRSILFTIFRRPFLQVALGIGTGALLVFALARGLTGPLAAGELGLVGMYAVLMLGVCLVACAVPTQRALAVEPTEALRADE